MGNSNSPTLNLLAGIYLKTYKLALVLMGIGGKVSFDNDGAIPQFKHKTFKFIKYH